MDKELEEVVNWLSALDIKSEYEATNKESILNYIDKIQKENSKLKKSNEVYINSIQSIASVLSKDYIEKDKIKEILKDLNSEAIKAEKDFDAIYKKENKDMQDFYTTRDLTNQLQMISWFEGILEEVLEEKECKK